MTTVYVDIAERDVGSYVRDAQRAVASHLTLPPGYRVVWSGQFEAMERVRARLKLVVPVTLGIIFVLLYLNFRGVPESLIVMLTVPFALVGGVWSIWALGYNTSVAVWVGFIALAGVAAETGVVMLIYLDDAYRRRLAVGVWSPRDICRRGGSGASCGSSKRTRRTSSFSVIRSWRNSSGRSKARPARG